MVVRSIFFNIGLMAFLLAWPVQAAEPLAPLNLKGIYQFEFSGMPVGRMGVEAEQTTNAYTITTDVMTTGLVKLFTKHSSHSTVDANGKQTVYETHYRTKKKRKHVKLTYKNGSTVEEIVEPPDNRATRPAVPEHLKKTAFDLLSFNLRLRAMLWNALHSPLPLREGVRGWGSCKDCPPPQPSPSRGEGVSFSLNAYDGRRLTEVTATVIGRKTIKYKENDKFRVIAMSLKRKPLAGFTQSELNDFKAKEPPLYMYYSDDGRLIPILLEVTLWFGKLSATLAKECRTGESCLLGIRE